MLPVTYLMTHFSLILRLPNIPKLLLYSKANTKPISHKGPEEWKVVRFDPRKLKVVPVP